MTRSAPRAVVFDLDETLSSHRGAVRAGLATYLAELGAPFSEEDPEQAFLRFSALEDLHYEEYLAGEIDFMEQRIRRASAFASGHGLAPTTVEARHWFEAYTEHYRRHWHMFPDALPCLEALAAAIPGVRFGIITNGEEAYQRRKLEQIGLADRFEQVICSGTFGVAKPAAAIFQHAASLLGAEPSEAVYIGDRFAVDAVGAADAGLRGVWLNRFGLTLTSEERARAEALGIAEITGLEELPAVLRTPGGK